MNRIKLNKKGSAMIELLISIVIFASILLIVTNFKTYIATHKASIFEQITLYSYIDTELANIYSEDDWDNLVNKEYQSKAGAIYVEFEDKGISEFNTKVVEVNFKLQDLNKTLLVERSVYYNE